MMILRKAAVAAQVEREHDCLNRDMGDILDDMNREVQADDFSTWRLEFTWRLRDFKNHLLRHFDVEEESGLREEILSEAPHYLPRVSRLEAEHEQIIAELDAILADAKLLVMDDKIRLQAFRKRVDEFLSAIRAHEIAERALIQSVYYQEYGYPAAS